MCRFSAECRVHVTADSEVVLIKNPLLFYLLKHTILHEFVDGRRQVRTENFHLKALNIWRENETCIKKATDMTRIFQRINFDRLHTCSYRVS